MNTKQPLSYKQKSFGCFLKKFKVIFFQKHPKRFCLYLSNQISLRGRFVFKTNGRISSITSYNDLYEVIEDILLFVLNTKQPLSYKQKSFGCFLKKFKVIFFQKHPKLFCLYLSNQISLRSRFVFITNNKISYMTSYKVHCFGFCESWDIKATLKVYFGKLEKTPNFGCEVGTFTASFMDIR